MFTVSSSVDPDLTISLACPDIACGEVPSFGFSVPVSFEWLTIRDAAQSCYDWIEDAVSAALCFTVRVSGFVQRISARVHSFCLGISRAARPRMILRRFKQFRL